MMAASVNVSAGTLGDVLTARGQGSSAFARIGSRFRGLLEEFRFYKRGLSVDELKEAMFQPLDAAAMGQDVIAYYKFNDAETVQLRNTSHTDYPQMPVTADAPTIDQSLHENHATIKFTSGAPLWAFGPSPFTPACPLSLTPSQVKRGRGKV